MVPPTPQPPNPPHPSLLTTLKTWCNQCKTTRLKHTPHEAEKLIDTLLPNQRSVGRFGNAVPSLRIGVILFAGLVGDYIVKGIYCFLRGVVRVGEIFFRDERDEERRDEKKVK